MLSSRFSRRLAVSAAVAASAALILSGCARADTPAASSDPDGNGVEASPGITDTVLTLGSTSPLSGGAAAVGTCAVDGMVAYFEYRNAEGGITFGDGKTRTIDVKALDDGYDPQKALANFQQLSPDVFAMAMSLGTPTNRAWREAAIDTEVPQVLVQTGDPLFSDRTESPWQLGLLPTYPQEGAVFGELLAASSESYRVAVLYQNDDFGLGYVEGFKEAIADADNVEIVKELGYEATDMSVSAQITELAATDADIVFNAMSSLPALITGALTQADSVDWHPAWFFPSTSSSPVTLKETQVADKFPAIYSTASTVVPGSPAFDEHEQSQVYLDALSEYTSQEGVPAFPQCLWSWIGGSVLEEAFTQMTEPTRENFMDALLSIEGFQAPFLIGDAVIDTTQGNLPAMSGNIVQQYNGTGYDPVESLG